MPRLPEGQRQPQGRSVRLPIYGQKICRVVHNLLSCCHPLCASLALPAGVTSGIDEEPKTSTLDQITAAIVVTVLIGLLSCTSPPTKPQLFQPAENMLCAFEFRMRAF
jgi:hypothetical protein